jgi:hypothetical protein
MVKGDGRHALDPDILTRHMRTYQTMPHIKSNRQWHTKQQSTPRRTTYLRHMLLGSKHEVLSGNREGDGRHTFHPDTHT